MIRDLTKVAFSMPEQWQTTSRELFDEKIYKEAIGAS
jgi:hypothetical protein